MLLVLDEKMVVCFQVESISEAAQKLLAHLVSEGFEISEGNPVTEFDHIALRPMYHRENQNIPYTSGDKFVAYVQRYSSLFDPHFYVVSIASPMLSEYPSSKKKKEDNSRSW